MVSKNYYKLAYYNFVKQSKAKQSKAIIISFMLTVYDGFLENTFKAASNIIFLLLSKYSLLTLGILSLANIKY